MTDWTAGYVAEVGYTFGYFQELNPLRVKLAFLSAGLAFPEFGTACELGFGQGLSANIHGAASVTQWYGTDFNPSQAGFAQELALASGDGAKLHDDAFADFINRVDLPDFDFIGIHGIWSWISDENRRVIVDFIKKKLKVGGVLYISYNTFPGRAVFSPMRHLMTEHADVLGSVGKGIVSRIDGAIDFAEKLLATNPLFKRAHPQIEENIQKIKEQDRHYLAHEYFNKDWHPMHFSTMVDCLKPAKLQYACSAHYLDHIDALNLTEDQQVFLNDIPAPMFRESVRDFMVNQQFRKDYWVKGARKINPMEQAEQLRLQKVILIAHRSKIRLKVNGAVGEASMSEAVYNPILDLLTDYKVKTLGQLEQELKDKNINFAQITQAALVLCGGGSLAVVQDEQTIQKVKKKTDKINAHLMNKARGSNEIGHLASPVTGGGVAVGRFEQLFLLALAQGKKQPSECVHYVWQTISAQGKKLIKEGKALETVEENLAELTVQAETFAEEQLPILQALQIA